MAFQIYFRRLCPLQTILDWDFINMNALSHSILIENQGSPFKQKILLKRQRKVKTEKDYPQLGDKSQRQQQTDNHLINLLDSSGKDFSSIFVKHKRNDYSGYKQYNMNKSKIIRFQQEHKEIQRYQTPRNYEINIKNIAKLRKRFSLEPILFKGKARDSCQQFQNTIFVEKQLVKLEQQMCESKPYHIELKQILKQMSRQNITSQRTYTSSQNDIQAIQQEKDDFIPKTQFKKYGMANNHTVLHKKTEIHEEQLMATRKPYCIQLRAKHQEGKSKQRRKSKNNQMRSKGSLGEILTQNQEVDDLCGWSNQSFYPKIKAKFFHEYEDKKQ